MIVFGLVSAVAISAEVFELVALIAAVGTLGIAIYTFLSRFRQVRFGPIEVSQLVDDEADAVRARLGSAQDTDYDEREYRLLSEYHAQGLSQAKTSFAFSIVFAVLGFAVIAIAVFLGLGSSSSNAAGTTVSLVSGAIVEAVAALFFVQSNRARALMVTFFDRLRADRRLRDALKLAEGIDDEKLRSRLQTQLALSMADSSDSEGTLDLLLRVAR